MEIKKQSFLGTAYIIGNQKKMMEEIKTEKDAIDVLDYAVIRYYELEKKTKTLIENEEMEAYKSKLRKLSLKDYLAKTDGVWGDKIFISPRKRKLGKKIRNTLLAINNPCVKCHQQCDLINVMKETSAGLKHYLKHPIQGFRLVRKILMTKNPYF